jgi:hypothetical protein
MDLYGLYGYISMTTIIIYMISTIIYQGNGDWDLNGDFIGII